MFLALSLLCTACGPQVSGSVNGQKLDAKEAVFFPGAIDITNFSNTCADLQQKVEPEGAVTLSLHLKTEPGTYQVGSGLEALFITQGQPPSAKSGQVVISSATSSKVDGTFDLVFENGSLSGSFSAAACP